MDGDCAVWIVVGVEMGLEGGAEDCCYSGGLSASYVLVYKSKESHWRGDLSW